MIKRGNRESRGAYQIVYIAPGLVPIPAIAAAGFVRGDRGGGSGCGDSGGGDSGGGDSGGGGGGGGSGRSDRGGGSYGEYERSKTIEPTAQHML